MEQTVKCMRSPEIDIAKGIGILLVVLGHAVPDANMGIQNMFWAAVFNWIYSFHMARMKTIHFTYLSPFRTMSTVSFRPFGILRNFLLYTYLI